MGLDSRIRLARRKGAGARIHPHEIPDVCEALRLLRACERAERGERPEGENVIADGPATVLDAYVDDKRIDL